MKRTFLLLSVVFSTQLLFGQIERLERETDERFNFYITSDVGRNGYYQQKPIAEKMGEIAETVDIEFITSLGDIHHFDGIQSVDDPLWMTNFELVYSHPELMIEWFSILGNHEYQGNIEAFFDYNKISRRWRAEEPYYTQLHELKDGSTLRLLYIDTPPMIDKYRQDTIKYKAVATQDMQKQLKWIESVLKDNKATWTVVMGHHPVLAQTTKNPTERTDLQKRLAPMMRKYKVDFYINGHIHNFQHITEKESDINYIVNSAGSLSREVSPIEGTQFCSNQAGFSIFSVDGNSAKIYFLNQNGDILHTVIKERK